MAASFMSGKAFLYFPTSRKEPYLTQQHELFTIICCIILEVKNKTTFSHIFSEGTETDLFQDKYRIGIYATIITTCELFHQPFPRKSAAGVVHTAIRRSPEGCH